MVHDPLRGKLTPVEVRTLLLDPTSQSPVLILSEVEPGGGAEGSGSGSADDRRVVPIWIGLYEAGAIQMSLEGTEFPRPMTHDLAVSLVNALDSRLIAVVVHSIEEGTFLASLRLQRDEHLIDVDARPSDAIALALRAGAEILVSESVFEALANPQNPQQEREAALKEWFEGLDPDDLGKYTM